MKIKARLVIYFCILCVLFFSARLAMSAEVALEWEPNTETNLAGYKVYYDTDESGGPYTGTGLNEGNSPIDVGNVTEFHIKNMDLKAHNYWFVVTAYNTEGFESGFSNEVTTKPPNVPAGLKVKVTVEVTVN